jgi:hypothetical protein
MTTLGLTILIAAGAISFALAALIALVPMDFFVRASVVSLGFIGWFIFPFVAPGHEIDIAAAYWFGVALSGMAAWVLGLATALLMRSGLRSRSNREQLSP